MIGRKQRVEANDSEQTTSSSEKSRRPASSTDSGTRRIPSIGRRTCLRAGLVTAVGGAGILGSLGSASGTQAILDRIERHDDTKHSTLTLDPGEQIRFPLRDGETFEHLVLDQTAEGALFSFNVEEGAKDWAIQNVGWKGVAPSGSDRDETFLIHAQGEGLIENIFIDQRGDDGEGSDVGGIWTHSKTHNGHLECRHNFIAGCGNNASYTSGEGWADNDGSGTVEHVHCYHRENTVSNYRLGIPGSRVKKSVSIANGPSGKRGTYPSSDSQMCRAIWAWHHEDIVMEECAIWHDPSDVQPAEPFWATHRSDSGGDGCTLEIVDCDINESWEEEGNELVNEGHGGDGSSSRTVKIEDLGTDPDIEVLGEGVPTSPEMAGNGERELPPQLGEDPDKEE